MTTNSYNSAFGERVRHLRLERNLSQEELSLKAGLDRTYVSALERGRRNPTLSTIATVLSALDISFGDFFKGFDS